jgi:hypothetical protein
MGDWRTVANNEAPTYSDAKWAVDNNVFYLNSGQSNTDSLQLITKSQALAKYTISSENSFIKPKANNQIVARRDFTPTVSTKFDKTITKILPYNPSSSLLGNVLFSSGRIGAIGTFDGGFDSYGTKSYKALVMLGSDNLPNRVYQNEGDGFYTGSSAGQVFAITQLPDGGFAIGGIFNSYRIKGVSIAANNYIRLNEDLSVHSSFTSGDGTNGAVASIVVTDVFSLSLFNIGLAGQFGNYTKSGTTTTSSYAIEIGSNGSVVNSSTAIFASDGLFSRCSVKLDNGVVVIGGNSLRIQIVGGFTFTFGVVPLNSNMAYFSYSLPTFFNPNDSRNVGTVNVMKRLSSGNIAVGGEFYSIGTPSSGTVTRNCFAVFSSDMQSIVSSNVLFAGSVYDIEQQNNGQILVSGEFDTVTYNGTTYSCFNVARLNSDLSLDTSLLLANNFFTTNTGGNTKVYAISTRRELFSDNQIIVGGYFNGVKRTDGTTAPSRYAAKLSNNGVYDVTW